jgi:hypothetical protein
MVEGKNGFIGVWGTPSKPPPKPDDDSPLTRMCPERDGIDALA